MFKLYDKVRIKKNGVTGIIMDISEETEAPVYVIESDVKRNGRQESDAYPSLWALYDCVTDEIESVK